MKKRLQLLLSVLLMNTFAFTQAPKKWENPCPTCLPGVSYGFEWPEPPSIPEPDPSNPPEIIRWTGDLSVSLFQIGQIQQERDKPYFIVIYSITITNVNAPGPLYFNLKLSNRFNPPQFSILDPSVLNTPKKFYHITDLQPGNPQTFQDTVRVLYPFTLKNRSNKKNFLKIPVDIIAEIPATGFTSRSSTVILTDPDPQNNKATITLTSPLPLKYVKPNTN